MFRSLYKEVSFTIILITLVLHVNVACSPDSIA